MRLEREALQALHCPAGGSEPAGTTEGPLPEMQRNTKSANAARAGKCLCPPRPNACAASAGLFLQAAVCLLTPTAFAA